MLPSNGLKFQPRPLTPRQLLPQPISNTNTLQTLHQSPQELEFTSLPHCSPSEFRIALGLLHKHSQERFLSHGSQTNYIEMRGGWFRTQCQVPQGLAEQMSAQSIRPAWKSGVFIGAGESLQMQYLRSLWASSGPLCSIEADLKKKKYIKLLVLVKTADLQNSFKSGEGECAN